MIESHNVCLETFKALSDDTRLAIIEKLAMQELCACQLQEAIELTQSSLSYHMKILADAGLISTTREGKWIRYSLKNEKFIQLQKILEALLLQK